MRLRLVTLDAIYISVRTQIRSVTTTVSLTGKSILRRVAAHSVTKQSGVMEYIPASILHVSLDQLPSRIWSSSITKSQHFNVTYKCYVLCQ